MVACTIFKLLVFISFLIVPGAQGGKRTREDYCELDWTGINLPIILRENNHQIINPIISRISATTNKQVIRIGADENVFISCGRRGFVKSGTLGRLPQEGIAAVRAKCNAANGKLGQPKLVIDKRRNEYLSVFESPKLEPMNKEEETDKIEFIRCQSAFQATAIAITKPKTRSGNTYTSKTCDSNRGNEYHIINFNPKNMEFFTQIEVCFDKEHETTIWTKHTLPVGISGGRDGTWKEDYGLFTSKMEEVYTEINKFNSNKASKVLSDLLGMDVIPPPTKQGRNPQKKIDKGHLSPNADFKTPAEREATFHYINALPQWAADNNGNWAKIVEVSVKKLAEEKNSDLNVITGGHEILSLKNIKSEDVLIYLKPTAKVSIPQPPGKVAVSQPAGKVPVPKYLWKVVVQPNTNEGVAFVTNNDPFIGEALSPLRQGQTEPDTLCTDVCDLLDTKWFTGNDRKNLAKGYTYCCEVSDLMTRISSIPSEYEDIQNLLGKKPPAAPGRGPA